ncbi:MAG: HAD hydrolase-like protein [Holosporales bacterium]|nr:HAD hydrolase-like protein [Holosporales bacterium]
MFCKNLTQLYENYNSFLIDLYGVLFDGKDFFKGAIDFLKDMKDSGKKLIILSNTALISRICKKRYLLKGLVESVHYDMFISSGETFRQTLNDHLVGAKTYFTAFAQNNDVFDESSFLETKSMEKADFIYVGPLNKGERIYTADDLKTKSGLPISLENLTSIDCHDIQGLDDITKMLDLCLKNNKLLVIVNPDILALESIIVNGYSEKRPVLCQGIVGEFYEKMGGKVLYFGKPYSPIYDFARKFVSFENAVMIGDTPWTDILGGNIAKLDTILTLTGVSGEFLNTMDESLSITEKLDKLNEEVTKKMTHRNLFDLYQGPTHVIESFA